MIMRRTANHTLLDHPPSPARHSAPVASATRTEKQRLVEPAPTSTGTLTKAFPGRTKRRKNVKRKSSSFLERCYARWVEGVASTFASLVLAVLLWYCLGVISIGTSKILLTKAPTDSVGGAVGGVPPLFLTLQQLMIGSSLLRILLHFRFLNSPGLQAWPAPADRSSTTILSTTTSLTKHHQKRKHQKWLSLPPMQPDLIAAGLCFSGGFLVTNYSFSGSSAAFVETIKAAEPITSATIAVLWGIEVLSREEVMSLGAIVAGVLLSTLGNHSGGATDSNMSLSESIQACVLVMVSNLCFSFRGLYQKLFRATPEGNSQVMDDLNLQFRMQLIGVVVLSLPVLILELPSILKTTWRISMYDGGLIHSGILQRYVALALLNGCAFTCYNLASTYILTRISVVHHAALNCIRRIFAIVVTSVYFVVPITATGVLGIAVSFLGFMSFTHYKVKRQRQPRPVSSLLPISAMKNAEP